MYCVDVNILVHAFAKTSPAHAQCRTWLDTVLGEQRAVAFPLPTLSGFLRLVTNRAVLTTPSSPDRATAFTDWLLTHPRTFLPGADQRVYAISRDLIREHGLRGNDVPDAVLAATALHLGATLATADRGFRRFGGLPVMDPTQE